jgi:5'-nucleotidase
MGCSRSWVSDQPQDDSTAYFVLPNSSLKPTRTLCNQVPLDKGTELSQYGLIHSQQIMYTEVRLPDQTRPLILVTNDDGSGSPGIIAGVRCVLDLGEVWVVAPRTQQSGLSRSFPASSTFELHQEVLEINGSRVNALALDASPAQAVRHAILSLLPRMPALAISGINYGENIGGVVTISGTVGAAIEAASFGIPSLAASLETACEHHFTHSDEVDFSASASVVCRLAKHLLRHGMPDGVDILKVDVPCDATPETPWRITRVARQRYFVNPVTVDQQGQKPLARYIRQIDFDTLEPDSDVHAVAVERVVSITPLTIDLTASTDLHRLQQELLAEHRFDPDAG